MKMTFDEVIELIKTEQAHQEAKYGELERRIGVSFGTWLLIAEEELAEAKHGHIKHLTGRSSGPHELVQVAAVCINALRMYGMEVQS